jgi:hypothetical protein
MTPGLGREHRRRFEIEPVSGKLEQLVFLAEVDSADDERSVRFRYVIDGSAELTLSREWWEQLGEPDAIEVSVRRNP